MASVTLLIGRFQQGSSSAFGHLFCRFLPRTARLASRRSSPQIRARRDGDDIAQSVFWELYRAVRDQRRLAANLCDTPSLLTTLAMLTRQQLLRSWRYETRECRDIRRTASYPATATGLDPFDQFNHDKGYGWLREIQSRETIEEFVALLPNADYKAIVHLLLQGRGVPDIACDLGYSVRTIQRYLVEIRSVWQSLSSGRESLAARVPLPRPAVGDPPR